MFVVFFLLISTGVATNETHLFVTGGYNEYNSTSSEFVIYDIAGDSWSIGPNLNQARGLHGCVYAPSSNAIYVFGGRSKGNHRRSIEKFDLSTSTHWEVLSDVLSWRRYGIFALYIDNFIYATGGFVYTKRRLVDVLDTRNDSIVNYCCNLGASTVYHDLVQNPYDDRLYYLMGSFNGHGGDHSVFYKIEFICPETEEPTHIPSKLPNTAPSSVPTTIPSTLPSTIPSTLPTAIPTTPTNNPTNLPSYQPITPTNYPSILPSSIPTVIPTFGFSDFNYSVVLAVVLYSDIYNATILSTDSDLTRMLIYALKRASIVVRYDLVAGNEIDVQIQEIEVYDKYDRDDASVDHESDDKDKQFKVNNTGAFDTKYQSLIVFIVGLWSDWGAQLWVGDIISVLTEFEIELFDLLSEDDSFAVQLLYAEQITVPTGAPTSQPTEFFFGNGLITTEEYSDDGSGSTNKKGVSIWSLSLDAWLYNIVGFVIISGLICTCAGYFDAIALRQNEIFKLSTMFVVIVYFLHVISEVFFVLQVFSNINARHNGQENRYHTKVYWKLVIFITSVTFIVAPIFTSYVQLYKSITIWLRDIETQRTTKSWMQMHLQSLYTLSILFGSAFAAIEICNSNLFHLSVFNMKLSRRQKAVFRNKRMFSTVLLRVKCWCFVIQSIFFF